LEDPQPHMTFHTQISALDEEEREGPLRECELGVAICLHL